LELDIFYFLVIHPVQVTKGLEKPHNPVLHDYYHRKITEGKSKKQALVCFLLRLVKV